jgi:DNA-binding transcriptional MerR regulator
VAIDTLKVAKRLREAGFSEPQAEAVVAAVQEGTEGAELATKPDLAELRGELKTEIAALRAELHETELRLEAKIEAVRSELKADIAALKADILNRVFGLILGALVVNIVAMIGAVFTVAKLLGH